MILYNSLGFLVFTDVSLIQKVEIKLLKLVYFLLALPYEKMLTLAKIFTQSKLKLFHKNLIHQGFQRVFVTLFVAEIYRF